MERAEAEKKSTAASPSPQASSEDRGKHPGRLIAYYALLFFFMFLTSLLLQEVANTFELQKLETFSQLIHDAFNLWAQFDRVAVTLFSLFLSFIFILPIGWVYTLTKEEEDFDPSLVQTIVVLAMVVTGVMVVVGSDLARAFGLAGVVAAVRFRNTLKDTKDAIYVFIAVAIGMGCGYGVYPIAVFLSVIMSLTMFLLWKYQFGSSLRKVALTTNEGKTGKGQPKALQKIYAQGSAEAYQRIEHDLQRQIRLMQQAEFFADKNGKKANAGLIIESSDARRAQKQIDNVLASFGGRWQLTNVTTNAPGKLTLEYVGRLPKETTAAALIDALQENGTTTITDIEFRSLKGLKNPKAQNKSEEKGEAED
ncbi:MAG: DUF4956 domain-containing protein [candidate division KSB1 bacterium]|nr:DUF4956 domain-containing protein [candidate division KSB1 bacterium]